MIQKLNSFIIECRRVLRVTKKPDSDEFKTIVKVSGLGILLIGAMGFLIFILKEMITWGLKNVWRNKNYNICVENNC